MEGCLNRTMNVGISTTSTTSRSTSKSSGGLYKGEDYLRSTSTSTSGHVPSEGLYPPNTGIPPYGGYDQKAYHEKRPNGSKLSIQLLHFLKIKLSMQFIFLIGIFAIEMIEKLKWSQVFQDERKHH